MENKETENLKSAFLKLVSTNITDGYDIEYVGKALYGFEDNKQIIKYTDTSEDFDKHPTTITISNNSLIKVEREANERTTIIIERGVNHTSQYGNISGIIFMLTFVMNEFSSSLDENGGDLHFRYQVESEFQIVSEIEFNITIKAD